MVSSLVLSIVGLEAVSQTSQPEKLGENMRGGRHQGTRRQEQLALVLPGSISATTVSSRAGDSVDGGEQEMLLCLQPTANTV